MKRARCAPVGPKSLNCLSGVLTLVCCRLARCSAVMASAGACRVEPLGIPAHGLQLHADQFELTGLLEEDSLKWDEWRH